LPKGKGLLDFLYKNVDGKRKYVSYLKDFDLWPSYVGVMFTEDINDSYIFEAEMLNFTYMVIDNYDDIIEVKFNTKKELDDFITLENII
jgi:hypothetical protein